MHKPCPCDASHHYAQCCEPYLKGTATAATPEILMRSRYSAFAKRKFAYLAKTMAGSAAAAFNLQQAQTDAADLKWLKLEVLNSKTQGSIGTVEFKAHFRFKGQSGVIHELSQFDKIDSKWFYVDQLPLT